MPLGSTRMRGLSRTAKQCQRIGYNTEGHMCAGSRLNQFNTTLDHNIPGSPRRSSLEGRITNKPLSALILLITPTYSSPM